MTAQEEVVRTNIKRIAAAAMLAGLPSLAQAAGPPELEPLSFLIGEWPSRGKGGPGEGTGTAVFTRSLQDRVMLRSSFAEYPASDGKPASRHDDLMIIWAIPGQGVRADFYDSEGHVIHYSVRSPAPGQAVFESDETAGAPRFRLTYKLESSGVLHGGFEIAPPGAPQAYKPYLSWESRKAAAPAK